MLKCNICTLPVNTFSGVTSRAFEASLLSFPSIPLPQDSLTCEDILKHHGEPEVSLASPYAVTDILLIVSNDPLMPIPTSGVAVKESHGCGGVGPNSRLSFGATKCAIAKNARDLLPPYDHTCAHCCQLHSISDPH